MNETPTYSEASATANYTFAMLQLADRMHAYADSGPINADAMRNAADNLQQMAANLQEGE